MGIPGNDPVLVLTELAPDTLAVLAGPEFVLNQAGQLQSHVVHCDDTDCFVLAGQPVPAIGPGQYAYGLWQVVRSSDEVIAPTRATEGLGVAAAVAGTAAGQLAVTLARPGETDPFGLSVWDVDGTIAGFSLPEVTHYGYGPAFFEGSAMRLFLTEPRDDSSDLLLEQLLEDGEFSDATAVGQGKVYAQCGGNYYGIDDPPGGGLLTVTRWRPAQEPAFEPLVVVPYVFLRTLCCSEALIAVQAWNVGDETVQWSVYSPDGQLTATVDLGRNTWVYCTPAGENLVVVPGRFSEQSAIYVVTPTGSVRSLSVHLPEGTSVGVGWAAEASEHELRWAWRDADTGDAYLSFYEL